MDKNRINKILVDKTAELIGLKPSQVNKIIRQYYDAILKIVNKIDPCSITHDQYLNLIKKGIYVPGLGIFELNWKHIEAWQNKNKKTKKND